MKIKINAHTFIGKYFYHFYKNRKFKSSEHYWENRYAKGGNSGVGSYNRLAEFKAEVLNKFVLNNNIHKIIEFGCGDGNQLRLYNYPKYIGFDVSKTILENCIRMFSNDNGKSFFLYNSKTFVDNQNLFNAELTISIDVIYHLIEDDIFETYMHHLFNTSRKFVIIYASNNDSQQLFHVRERKFTKWIDEAYSSWKLVEIIPNRYPYDPKNPTNTSFADFYIYEKTLS